MLHRRAKKGRKGRGKAAKAARGLMFTLAATLFVAGGLLVGVAAAVVRQFGKVSFQQMLMNLPGGGGGEGEVAPEIVQEFVISGVVIPLVLMIGAVVLARWCYKTGKKRRINKGPLLSVALASSLAFAGVGFAALDDSIGLTDYLLEDETAPSLWDYTVEPTLEQPLPADKNLILIYLESMDDAFGDKELVGYNALEPLQKETEDWGGIQNYMMNPALGGWTMAAIVSTQCGLPVLSPEGEKLANDETADRDTFMPGATCLGDVLKDAGYKSTFLSGADKAFAGKGAFLQTHGFDIVKDKNYWKENGEKEFSNWGLSDRRLFENAKEEALALKASGEPFVLSMLTVDNHNPVYRGKYCDKETDAGEFLDVVRCQADLVTDYLQFLEKNGFMEDSVVAIIGDHPVLGSYDVAKYRDMFEDNEQKAFPLFNRFYSPDGPVQFSRDTGYQIDMFPTLVEMLGGDLKGSRAGIGLSMFVAPGDADAFTSILPMVYEDKARLITSSSPGFAAKIWGQTTGAGLSAPQSGTPADNAESGKSADEAESGKLTNGTQSGKTTKTVKAGKTGEKTKPGNPPEKAESETTAKNAKSGKTPEKAKPGNTGEKTDEK